MEATDVHRNRSSHENEPKFEVSQSLSAMTQYLRQLKDYCMSQVHDVVLIHAPGNRPSTSLSRLYRKSDKPIFVHCKEGHCLRLAFVNAVERDAEKLLYFGPVHIESLASGVD